MRNTNPTPDLSYVDQGNIAFHAERMNCTEDEAWLLLRGMPTSRYHEPKARGPIRSLCDFLFLNRSAGIFFGTVGYWTFGLLLFSQLNGGSGRIVRTENYLVDMMVNNPLFLLTISFVLLVMGLAGDSDRPSLFRGLDAMVMIPSIVVAYLGSIVMGAIFLITLPFALSSSSFFDMGMMVMFLLPAGYLGASKLTDLD